MDSLRICHLYPDLLNLYGDRGNIIAMRRRLEWRGIGVMLDEVSIGTGFDPGLYDIVFIGGGQDFEQEVLLADLGVDKKKKIKYAVEDDVVFLGICGGYQLLGTNYVNWNGVSYDFIGAIDIHTVGKKKRMIGNYVFEMRDDRGRTRKIAGFENHSGATYLGHSVKPLGKVLKGHGNNGEDGMEGATYRNVFCSYSHGPLLPKNPALCDMILERALIRKYGSYALAPLDDEIENIAREHMIKRLL